MKIRRFLSSISKFVCIIKKTFWKRTALKTIISCFVVVFIKKNSHRHKFISGRFSEWNDDTISNYNEKFMIRRHDVNTKTNFVVVVSNSNVVIIMLLCFTKLSFLSRLLQPLNFKLDKSCYDELMQCSVIIFLFDKRNTHFKIKK